MNNIDISFNSKIVKKIEINFELLQIIIFYHSLLSSKNNKKFSTVVRELLIEGYSIVEKFEKVPKMVTTYQDYIMDKKYFITVKVDKFIYDSILHKCKTRNFNSYKFSYIIYVILYIAVMVKMREDFKDYFVEYCEYF